ncbi:MAG TPA: AmmeMemoRadiSam system protein B [bacterium]|nr:AmmeMemoRadiSam system protein B [bacterium]
MNQEKYPDVQVRKPAVAGKFYSASEKKLQRAMEYFFGDAIDAGPDKPMAIIAPHAGYVFSGQIAADAYNQAKQHSYDVVVILGTNHTSAAFRKVSVYPRAGYQTPLGTARIDEELAARVLSHCPQCTYNPAVHEQEHSVEVQIPFLQYAFPEMKILPMVIGSADMDFCQSFGESLAEVLEGRNALIVASSDLSHYPAYDAARNVDRQTLEALTRLDPGYFHSVASGLMGGEVSNLHTCACGEGPIITAISAATKAGANCCRLISYANSGNAAVGSRDRVVGYGAVAFTGSEEYGAPSIFEETGERSAAAELTDTHKKVVLGFARKTITQFLTSETIPLARGFEPVLNRKQGVFVTLRKGSQLRGCVGHLQNDLCLCEAVGSMALQAAFGDRRFSPVRAAELPDIDIEVSVLTPYQKIENYRDIRLGTDGVLLQKNGRKAVFLPEVATRMDWDRDELLGELSMKAGLTRQSWKEGAELFVFQTEKFEESEFRE